MPSNTKQIYLASMGILTVLVVLTMGRNHLAEQKANEYLNQAQLNADKIAYTSASAPLLNDGVILYQVQFPTVKTPHKIEKLIINKENDELTLRLLGGHIDILSILRAQDPTTLKQRLFSYRPMSDALHRPLESLLFAGLDSVKGDISLNITEQLTDFGIQATLTLKGLGKIKLTGTMEKDFKLDDVLNNPLILTRNPILNPLITITDKGIIQRYNTYLTRVGKYPIQTKNGVIKITPSLPIILNEIITF